MKGRFGSSFPARGRIFREKAMSVTREVAAFIANAKLEDFRPEVIEKAKICLMDTAGVGIAGNRTKAGRCAVEFALDTFRDGPSSVWGQKRSLSVKGATWANAALACSLDMDDGHRDKAAANGSDRATGHIGGHPASVVVPAALATAQKTGASGEELLAAIIVAYETGVRIGGARNPATVFTNVTGNWGYYGAAIASGKLLGLEPGPMSEVLGVAAAFGSNPPGEGVSHDMAFNLSFVTEMSMAKESIGWASFTGAAAADLARRGFTGIQNILDNGDFFDPSYFSNLQDSRVMLSSYFKPYSCCRQTHATIDGVLELCKKHEIEKDKIQKITVRCSPGASKLNNPEPASLEQAQYSNPFCIGVAICHGTVSPSTLYEEMLNDTTVREVAQKVELIGDEKFQGPASNGSLIPSKTAVEVEILTDEGAFQTFVEHPKGTAENPMTAEELSGKFIRNAGAGLGTEKAEELKIYLQEIEGKSDLAGLGPLLAP